jgi:L-threonylcarbamoyladenylate synthase
MITEILSSQELEKAAAFLRRGEIVAFPTETVYGLGACVFQPAAIGKIFQVKKRPADNPLIVHIADWEQLELVAREVPEEFYRLAEVFCPGPLTLVLRTSPLLPPAACSRLQTVAVRMPAHPIARSLIQLVGEPLVAPSANLSGKPSSTTLAHVLEDFNGKIAAVIEGGATQFGIESTVVSLVDPTRPLLLRLGVIGQAQLEQALGRPFFLAEKAGALISPGMKYRHYAPEAKVLLFTEWEKLRAHLEGGRRQMILMHEPVEGEHSFPLRRHELYAALRLADRRGYEEVLVFCDGETLADVALMDRLTKSSRVH